MATAAEAQALMTVANCVWCSIPPGMVPYAQLAIAVDIANSMAVPTTPNELMAQAKCLECIIPQGLVGYVTLGVLIQYANGDPVPTDPQELVALANCLTCIPAGMLPYVTLEAVRNLA